jgi:hypothetical protein
VARLKREREIYLPTREYKLTDIKNEKRICEVSIANTIVFIVNTIVFT